MHDDLASAYPSLDIQLLGINERGQESANSLAVADRTLPWLQAVDQNGNNVSAVWNETWQLEYRDVVVLNGANETAFVYNLTTHDLGNATNYETLRNAILRTAIDDQDGGDDCTYILFQKHVRPTNRSIHVTLAVR